MKAFPAIVALLVLCLAGISLAEPDNLSSIRKLVANGRNYAAEKKLEALTEKSPKNAEAFALLAEVRLNMADLEGAETAIRTALDLVKDANPNDWKIFGRIAFERGIGAYTRREDSNTIKSYFADAETRFTEALRQNEKDREVRWWIGWAKEWQEYPKRAVAFYKEQIEKFPDEPGGYRRYGAMLSTEANGIGDGRNDDAAAKRAEALAIFDEGLAKAGPDAEIYYLRGLALEWAGRPDDARESYRNACRADPGYDKPWRRLYDLKVPLPELHALATEVMKKDRTNATAAKWAGFALTAEEKFEAALDLMLKALAVHRENYGLWFQASRTAGRLYGDRATRAKSIPYFEKIHEYYPFSGNAANNIGLYHRDVTGNVKEAERWYEAAAEREPENQDILNDAGLIYLFYERGEARKKCLPHLLKTVSLVTEQNQKPTRGFWDALENLCKYYWEVDRRPEKVIQYAKLRNQPYDGVAPYSISSRTPTWKRLAEKSLGRK